MKLNQKHRRELLEIRHGANVMLRERIVTRVGSINISFIQGRNYLWREGKVSPRILDSCVLGSVAMRKALELAVFEADLM